MPYYSLSITPNRKKHIFHLQQKNVFLLLQHRMKFLPSNFFQPMKDCYNSANEKPLYIKLPLSSNEQFVYNSHSEHPLSSIKGCSSPLFFGLVCGLPFDYMPQIEILCCSRINSFCWKILSYLLKVNRLKLYFFPLS